ncbi:MAG TPA: tetratricopeptide repeat protein [Anaerolineaceae bacterium]|nr:tetratricopeptide repeat protein [Anaerolineaceae bacterium]
MNKRRKRSNPLTILILAALVGAGFYVNWVVVPATGPLFIPTLTPTRNPETYINEAQNYYAAGKINQAMEAYQQAIRANPSNAANYIALARLQVFSGNYQGALENAGNALVINQNNALALAVRGWAFGLMQPPDFLQAEASLTQAIELDKNNALAHAYYAEILGLKDQAGQGGPDTMDKAVAESTIALNLDPNLMEAHRARGYIQQWTGHADAAVREFQAAVAINKNIADLHLALGQSYFLLDDTTNAVNEFIQATTLNPKDPTATYMISRTYLKAGDYAKAAQYADDALKLAPESPVMNGNRGSIYYKARQYDKAIQYLSLAVRGGTTAEGVVVKGIPLDYNQRTLEFYNRYGLALAFAGQCGESLQVSKVIQEGVPQDDVSVDNAKTMIQICEGTLSTQTPEAKATQKATPKK